MIMKIASGGDAGADQAAWRVGRALGIATDGWMPRGFQTADGPHPEFADEFGAVEMPANAMLSHVECNVRDSDATLWIGETTTPKASATVDACQKLGKPCMPIYPDASFEPSHVADWIARNAIRVMHVTGSTEDEEPGIGDRVERFVREVLQLLGHE
jgi:hypothetical protein